MRREASRSGLVPSLIGWSLAAFVGVAAVVAVTQSRLPPPAPPAEPAETANQTSVATVTAPPLPAPLPVARLNAARVVEDVPAAPEPAPPVTGPRPAKTAPKTKTETQSRCGGATAGGRSPCPDVAFAALDRRVNAAFAAAMRSSATPGPLGRDQQDWIIRVDRIRRKDPASAEDLYRARVAELRALASQDVDHTQAPITQNNAESHNR